LKNMIACGLKISMKIWARDQKECL
jgi:hypothetical protein